MILEEEEEKREEIDATIEEWKRLIENIKVDSVANRMVKSFKRIDPNWEKTELKRIHDRQVKLEKDFVLFAREEIRKLSPVFGGYALIQS